MHQHFDKLELLVRKPEIQQYLLSACIFGAFRVYRMSFELIFSHRSILLSNYFSQPTFAQVIFNHSRSFPIDKYSLPERKALKSHHKSHNLTNFQERFSFSHARKQFSRNQ